MKPHRLITPIPSEQTIVEEVLLAYELPDAPHTIERNTVGFVNKTYIVSFGDTTFVLRESSRLTEREHLAFEVEALRYLENSGYELSPRLLSNRAGAYLTEHDGTFWMLQHFIPGEIRASWNDVEHFEGEMLRNFSAHPRSSRKRPLDSNRAGATRIFRCRITYKMRRVSIERCSKGFRIPQPRIFFSKSVTNFFGSRGMHEKNSID